MRRRGIPLIGAGAMMGGFGGGMGSPLLTALLSGGLGYVVGSGSGQTQMTEQQNVRIMCASGSSNSCEKQRILRS